jgi:peptidylprolyl isomerase/peptidyl-prolyl cis-trans isomerase B (cyclophilin B)
MGTSKRARQKERHRARLAAARSAQKRRDRKRRLIAIVGGLIMLGLVGGLLVNLNTDDGTTVATGDTDDLGLGSSTTLGDLPQAPDPTEFLTSPGEEITGETPCPAEDGSSPRTTRFEQTPPVCIEPDTPYAAVVRTTLGDFTVELDPESAPASVNNFVVLSRYHFYDDVAFHRVVPGFVIQAGDPLGDLYETPEPENQPGVGGPGYQFDDELPESIADYTAGSLAMANAGPGTNGSQWFVYVGPDDGSGMEQAGPNHPRFGEVVFGFDVIDAILQTVSPEGIPLEIVRITSVDIAQGDEATELLALAEAINTATTTTSVTPTTTGP